MMNRIAIGLLSLLVSVACNAALAQEQPITDKSQACRCGCGIPGCQCCPQSARAKAAVEHEAKIVMQSIPGCVACEQWMLTEAPKLVAVGWIVEPEKLRSAVAGRTYPRWRVCNLGRCVEIENCASRVFMERLRAFVNGIQAPRKVWRQVRPHIQIEGMIDDGFELVEER